ncbi:MAG: hypothetical protein ABSH42_19140 [Bryobacteraceae bacterium]
MRRVLQFLALGAVLTFSANADPIVMTAESLQNDEEVLTYFDGGFGSGDQSIMGSIPSGPGPSDGVTFTVNFTAFLSLDDGGVGNFGGNPLGDMAFTVLSNGQPAVMDVPGGFTSGFAMYYAETTTPEFVTIYSGLDGTGTLLATLDLPVTGDGNGLGNPACTASTDNFCPFFPIGVDFTGTADSVVFTATEAEVAFDGLTLGADLPPQVSEPDALRLFGLGLVSLLVATRRQRRVRP